MSKFKTSIDRYFNVSKKGSTISKEIFAGLITFLSMSYILFVNPSILGASGMDAGAVFMATAIASGLTTIFMGVFAKYPVALAPGMGVNAFFAFTVCGALGKSWQYALACVLISGILFMLISLTGIRKKVINAIPQSMKYAVSAGIGGFIMFIGLKNSGIIVANGATFVGLGSFASPALIIGLIGIIITLVLMFKKVRGSMLIGLVATCVIGLIWNYAFLNGANEIAGGAPLLPSFNGFELSIPSLAPTFGAAFAEMGSVLSSFEGYIIIFMFLFVDFFDTAGTLVAVGKPAGLMNDKGELVDVEKALLVDAAGTIAGSILGTSTVTSFVESTTGVEEGGRTGLTAVSAGVLFLLSIFLSPLLSVVSNVVTAPALVIVGLLMASNLKFIDFTDLSVAAPAFTTVIFMILSYSIATGLAMGFIVYVVAQVAAKKAKEVSPIMWALPILFLLYFILQAFAL